MADIKNIIIKENCNVDGSINVAGYSLLDVLHPIGSTHVSDKNINPSTYFGGTWKLTNKEFKPSYGQSSTNGTYFTLTSGKVSTCACAFIRVGNVLRLRLQITTAVEIADTEVSLGTINFAALGITGLTHIYTQAVGASDGGGAMMLFSIAKNGAMTSVDVIGKTSGTMASGAIAQCHCFFNIHPDYMIDSFCDKFYWERTA